jgi:2-methylaconitate cis-trans-isomerase PrpF
MMDFGDQIRTPTVLYRGGTSKAFFVDRDDLPTQDRDEIAQWILAIYGSPDPRQIDGVGGADGLTSKFAILGTPTHPDADIDYWFAQVGIDEPTVDWSLICGNISSAVGPYAIERGMVTGQEPTTLVRIHNVNTGKIIRAEVPVANGRPRVIGDQRIDGVPGDPGPWPAPDRQCSGYAYRPGRGRGGVQPRGRGTALRLYAGRALWFQRQ